MAKKLKKIFSAGVDEVAQLYAIESWHVSQSIDAFTGATDYDITVSGSSTVSGSALVKGTLDVSGSVLLSGPNTNTQYGFLYNDNHNTVFTNTVLTYDASDVSRPAVSGSITGGVNLSSLGKNRGVGFVLPTFVPADPTVGSTYVDIAGEKLKIYDGSSWREIAFTL